MVIRHDRDIAVTGHEDRREGASVRCRSAPGVCRKGTNANCRARPGSWF